MPKILIACIISFLMVGIVRAQESRDFVTVGSGLGMVYGDNAGIYKLMRFKKSLGFSIAYSKEISEKFDLRTTLGLQNINSGEFRLINDPLVIEWGQNEQAYFFRGKAYFADVMPVFLFNQNEWNSSTKSINLYAGLGVGGIFSQRVQRILRDGVLENGILMDGIVERSFNSMATAYIPMRVGISSNLEYDWDYGVELSFLTLVNSKIDGNEMKNKLIKPDILASLQFMVRRYIGR